MSDKKNKEEIENLDFNDADVELKFDNIKFNPQDGVIENLDFDVETNGSDLENKDIPSSETINSNETGSNSSSFTNGSDNKPESTSDGSETKDAALSESKDASKGENVSADTEKGDLEDESAGGINSSKEDTRSIKDKLNDKKENLQKAKDNIKNAPEKLRNAKDKAKDNINKAKDNIKNAPDNLRKKREDLKNKWNNRPKNAKELKERTKNGAKNAGNNLKNAGKNMGKNLKNGVKNGAKNAFNNSKLGRTINAGKKAVTRMKSIIAFFSSPLGIGLLIATAILLSILVISIIVPSIFASGSPGVGGEVSDEENYSKYSEVDQKTIDKLKEITQKYPTGDPTYAMAATIYPYIEEMQNGNVGSLRGKTNVEQEDDEDIYDETEQAENADSQDVQDNVNDTIDDDPYLVLLRESKYQNKFKKLLKESRNGEEALTTYLKETWFNKDAGYKELFDGVDNTEELANAIIDDLLNQKDDFEGYFFSNEVCSVNMSSIGTVEIDEMLKGNILVDVKVESCKTSNIENCESMYSTPISMEKYVMGVTYEEIGVSSTSDIEKVKAQMVAAKSYAIGRNSTMGWDIKQTDDGSYVIQIRSNTNDQDYCDVDTGCQDKINGAKRGPIDAATRALMSEAWEATKDVYIYNTDKKRTAGEFCQSRSGVCDFCSKGTCLAHEELSEYRNTTYDKIIGDQYSSYALITVQGDYADASIASGETCSISGLGIPDDQFKFYYQLDYPDVAFCGATDHTNSCESGSNSICSSGCGITSLAMLVANLSDDTSFDPIAANEEGKNNGGCAVGAGTYDTLFTNIANNHEGFRYEKLANTKEGANSAVAAIRDGALIVANVQANSPFTSGGHWIVLRGITEDGMVKVADPYSKEKSTTGTYNIDDFIDKNWLDGHSWYAIYGPKSPEIKAMNDAASEQGGVGEVIDTTNGIKGQFFAPIQNGNLKMYGKNSTNDYKYHDLGASCGTAVYSPVDGTATFKTITRNGKLASYGNEIEITTDDGYRFVLSHLKSFVGYNVKYGTGSTYPSSCGSGGCSTYTYGTRAVKQGEKIGLSGTSGNSSGCHLHIEIWKGGTRLEPSDLLGYDVQ